MTGNSLEIQALIYKIRKAIHHNVSFLEDFKRYYELTGDMTHTHFLQWAPSACDSLAKLRDNGRVMIAIAKEAKRLRGLLNADGKRPVNYGVQGHGSMVAEASGIVIEPGEGPRAKLAVDYTGKPLQGAYMGRKPVLGKTRRVRLPLTTVSITK